MAAAQPKNGLEVWPENWPAFILFCELQTQWNAGPNGLIGLKYEVLYMDLDRMDLTRDEFNEWRADIRAMELAALEAMQEQREQG